MIEPTDEMVEAARRAWADTMALNNFGTSDARFYNMTGIIAAHRDALAAVLAIVERDYRVEARCADAECGRKADHPGEHGWFDGREWVTW